MAVVGMAAAPTRAAERAMPAGRVSLSLQPGSKQPIRAMIVEGTDALHAAALDAFGRIGARAVAEARTAQGALDELVEADPEIVLLDLTKPNSRGLTTLPLLLTRRPAVAVIVVVNADEAGADIALRCLSLGAADYIERPVGADHDKLPDDFSAELARKISAVAGARRRRGRSPAARRPAVLDRKPRCILIGASTGGPEALATVLQRLGCDVVNRVPIIVIQHMPPAFTAALAENLALISGCPAHELTEGDIIRPGIIHIAPGGRHLRLGLLGHTVVARLDDGQPVNFCRPSADILFKDAAAVFGPAVLAIILTGMGRDGLNGARALAAAGASIIVQDEETSTVWGMPGSVARAGLASAVVPLAEIAAIVRGLVSESLAG
jgi:two-component system chemotaxis response regulator CheB